MTVQPTLHLSWHQIWTTLVMALLLVVFFLVL
jgi:hypothetical protein